MTKLEKLKAAKDVADAAYASANAAYIASGVAYYDARDDHHAYAHTASAADAADAADDAYKAAQKETDQ